MQTRQASHRWKARASAALLNKIAAPRHLRSDTAVKLESRGRAGAAHHEISTGIRLHDGIHEISHGTNCLLVPLRLINGNVAPA